MELYISREDRLIGSIYKGKVANILPGMQAAFVDIGLERNVKCSAGSCQLVLILVEDGIVGTLLDGQRLGKAQAVRELSFRAGCRKKRRQDRQQADQYGFSQDPFHVHLTNHKNDASEARGIVIKAVFR